MNGGGKTRNLDEKKGKKGGRTFVSADWWIVSENILFLACPWFSAIFSDFFLMTCFLTCKSEMIKINTVTNKNAGPLEITVNWPLYQLSGNGFPWVSRHISNSPGSSKYKHDTCRIQKGDMMETAFVSHLYSGPSEKEGTLFLLKLSQVLQNRQKKNPTNLYHTSSVLFFPLKLSIELLNLHMPSQKEQISHS